MLCLNELGLGDAGNVCFEDVVGIEKIRDDHVERFEEFRPGVVQFGFAREETGQRASLDGAEGVHNSRGVGQFGEGVVASLAILALDFVLTALMFTGGKPA